MGNKISAVIMKNLGTAVARQHHFKQWCSAVIELARFLIITADMTILFLKNH